MSDHRSVGHCPKLTRVPALDSDKASLKHALIIINVMVNIIVISIILMMMMMIIIIIKTDRNVCKC